MEKKFGMKGLGDTDHKLLELGIGINRKISDLNKEINVTQLKKKFLLKEALQNVARIAPDNYSRLAMFFKESEPPDTKESILHSKEIACLESLGDIRIQFETYLDISESSTVSSWLLNATYFNVDLSLKLEVTKEIEGAEVKEYVSAIDEVEFNPNSPILIKVADYLKDSPKCLQMVPSLLLLYEELKNSKADVITEIKKKYTQLNTSVNYDDDVLEIPLCGEGIMLMQWSISFVEMEFHLKDVITLETDKDILHLYSRHKSYDILTKKKILTNASEVMEFFNSLNK